MHQGKMAVRNFRNYKEAKVKLSPQVNVFYGKNAQGKTNFLESVSYLILGRSFRTYRDEELIREGEENFFFKDRKSTRLNSSHVRISYAVFCLKKKNNNTTNDSAD